jgi:Insertion element 4 transposase N-terminal/Transposase DDE domain
MYRVRYLEQNDKMSERVRLRLVEEVYTRELLCRCVQQSERRAQKARRVRHFTGLAVLWYVLAMVLWSRLAQGRVWDQLTHWLQDRLPDAPQEPAGASALAYQRQQLGVEPLRYLFEQGTHVLCERQTAGAWYRGYRLMALDGSYLARLLPNPQAVYPMQRPVWIRVIEYQLTDERLGEPGQVYRLATTWLNPRTAPANELIVLYHERWEIELVLDEIKTHLRVQQKVLRSHTPEGVRQELYALFAVHFAIRALMYCSALEAELDPDRLSFTEAMFQICQAATDEREDVSPAVQQWRAGRLRQRVRRHLLAERRLRIQRRELKQVYRKYKPRKRAVPPPQPFEPGERFEDFVVVLFRPTGSRLLTEVTPPGLI